MQKSAMKSPPRLLFTRPETAGMLGVSVVTLDRWTKAGRIQSRRLGHSVRYHRDEIERVSTDGLRD